VVRAIFENHEEMLEATAAGGSSILAVTLFCHFTQVRSAIIGKSAKQARQTRKNPRSSPDEVLWLISHTVGI
jgi:hypothetical protein